MFITKARVLTKVTRTSGTKQNSWPSCLLRGSVTCRRWALVRELFKKSQIVLVEQPDVFDLVLQNRNALDADAPRESRVALRIVADGFEDRRVHHAAAAHLDPSALLAHGAAGAVALPAAQVDLRARFGVRKETRTETHAGRRREHLLRER